MSPDHAVNKLAEIVAARDEFSEDEIYEAMSAAGIPEAVALRAYRFTQTAWAHALLAELGVRLSPDYLCFNASGEVTETVEGETTRYRMHVAIDADHGGRPVASVAYSLECRGVWTGAAQRGRAWHFAETITAGRANCAPHVEVELVPEGDALRFRLHPVFVPEQLAQATRRRTR